MPHAVGALPGGKVMIDVAYFGLHVHSETIDLCRETSCPVSAGDFVLSHKQTLPIFTPPVSQCSFFFLLPVNNFYRHFYNLILIWQGSYTLKMRMQDSNNHLLTCITFGFTIGFGTSVSES